MAVLFALRRGNVGAVFSLDHQPIVPRTENVKAISLRGFALNGDEITWLRRVGKHQSAFLAVPGPFEHLNMSLFLIPRDDDRFEVLEGAVDEPRKRENIRALFSQQGLPFKYGENAP